MKTLMAAGVALALAHPAAAQAPTIQQQFEAASAAIHAKDYARALPLFEALEARTGNNKRSRAIVRLRKGDVLFRLKRERDAVAAIRAGLAELPAGDASLRDDRYLGFSALGEIARDALNYTAAIAEFRAAEALAPNPIERLKMSLWLVEVETFVDSEAAERDLAKLNALAQTLTLDKQAQAQLQIIEGRMHLNANRFAQARQASASAVTTLGGLTRRTDLADVTARADTAVAAMLLGNQEDARKHLAMTGAGRLPKGSFGAGVEMRPPECLGEGGLRPDDVGIVEFSIADDGSVEGVLPIYASRGDGVALAFARSAAGWSWTPEALKEIPPFFRHRARVSLRCSNGVDRPSVYSYLSGEWENWSLTRSLAGPDLSSELSFARRVPLLRAGLATASQTHGAGALQTLPWRVALLDTSSQLSGEDMLKLANDTLAIMRGEQAPLPVKLHVELKVWAHVDPKGARARAFEQALATALSGSPYAGDAIAGSAIRLILADVLRVRSENRAVSLLDAVVAQPGLAANHPMRVGALLRLASIRKARGDAAAAQAAFEQSGLTAAQCALIDAKPALRSFGDASSKFPAAALKWGFEGWSQVEYDIDAQGKTLNGRTILSYPPFVFEQAAAGIVGGCRYTPSFRPEGGLGCGNATQRIRFEIPG